MKGVRMVDKDIEKVLIGKDQIKQAVERMAKEINKDYIGESLIVICVLKGSTVFYADLVRELDLDIRFDFITVASYGDGVTSSGHVIVKQDLTENITGKNVLIVEDVIDSGRTIMRLREIMMDRKPKSLKVASLLIKPTRQEIPVDAEYIGIEVPDEFVVGYGLDYAGKYRNLKDIVVLSRSVYEKE